MVASIMVYESFNSIPFNWFSSDRCGGENKVHVLYKTDQCHQLLKRISYNNEGKNMQPVPRRRKHATVAKLMKTCKCCKLRKPQSTTAIGVKRGKNTTSFMRGKTCNRCHDQAQEVQENLQPASSAGKRSNQCQGQKKAWNWYQARARETCIRC